MVKYLMILTGTPGTGKSSVAKQLQTAYNIPVLEINKIVKENELLLGYNHHRNTLIIDEVAVDNYLTICLSELEVVMVVGHYVEFPALRTARLVFALRCDPAILRKRLQERGYSQVKIDENIDAEIMQVCLEEGRAFFRDATILEFDTTSKGMQEIAREIYTQITSRLEITK